MRREIIKTGTNKLRLLTNKCWEQLFNCWYLGKRRSIWSICSWYQLGLPTQTKMWWSFKVETIFLAQRIIPNEEINLISYSTLSPNNKLSTLLQLITLAYIFQSIIPILNSLKPSTKNNQNSLPLIQVLAFASLFLLN